MTTTHANQLVGSGPQARSLRCTNIPHVQSISTKKNGLLIRAILFTALLVASSLSPLRDLFYFTPAAVRAGQWWRVVTHQFVHVSWYHLLLDGTAFTMLYSSLRESSLGSRVGFIVVSAAGSLSAAWMFAPQIEQLGLCGLSGVAHGLMAVTALEMISAGEKSGWWCLALVTGKALWEAATGHVVFEWIHFGMLGTPIAISHLGGVVGGIVTWYVTRRLGQIKKGAN